jgi:uncharacterized membrane protein YcaP (DUF421 family)
METVIRVTLIYLFILVTLRIMGKREFGQLSPLELVTLLMIPELVTQALNREDYSLTNAIVGVTTLLALVFLTSQAVHLSKTAEKLISGQPVILISRGTVLEDNLNRERISPEEIFTEMHKAGLHELDQVRWAILETDGKISLIPEREGAVTQARTTEKSKID